MIKFLLGAFAASVAYFVYYKYHAHVIVWLLSRGDQP